MELTGSSAAINNVRATLKRVAATGSRVLISGPAGVGKEVAARLLHNWSPRAEAPFIVVTAARMTPERVEEELFGVEEGGELRARACSSRRMAAPCSSTRSPTCRCRPRARSCAC